MLVYGQRQAEMSHLLEPEFCVFGGHSAYQVCTDFQILVLRLCSKHSASEPSFYLMCHLFSRAISNSCETLRPILIMLP